MNLTAERTVRELALEIPQATRVFEKFGIDYCCGGGKSLEDACSAARIDIGQVFAALQSASEEDRGHEASPNGSLASLIDYIISKHHRYTRDELARLDPLLDKVCAAHGERHPELLEVRQQFRALSQELSVHMMKEERVLFPYIERMEEAFVEGVPVLPAPFGTVENPVAAMTREHDAAGDFLRTLRALTAGYEPPSDSCLSYKTLYSALAGFERDLHQHIHLENNILFPRAIEMEAKARLIR